MLLPSFFLLLHLAVTFILLHGLESQQVEHRCPESCFCTESIEGGLVIDCSNMQLIKVPRDFPNTTQQLYLNNNLLVTIPSDSFLDLPLLCKLDLSHNRLTHMEPGALRGLADSLISLDLSSNLLETLDPNLLGDIRAHANLSHNPWQCDCRLQLAMPLLLLDPSSLAEVVCNSSEPEELGAQGLPFILIATDVDFCGELRKTTDVVMLITMFGWFAMVISYLVYYVRHNREDAVESLKSLPNRQSR